MPWDAERMTQGGAMLMRLLAILGALVVMVGVVWARMQSKIQKRHKAAKCDDRAEP